MALLMKDHFHCYKSDWKGEQAERKWMRSAVVFIAQSEMGDTS